MCTQDGDGWVSCRCGLRHWGLHGAAGLLAVRENGRISEALLQLRAVWTHQGGTWGLPGGARGSRESEVDAALREAHEETGLDVAHVRVHGTLAGTDHTDWRYTYVLATAAPGTAAQPVTGESDAVAWVPLDDVHRLALHPGLAPWWPLLRERMAATQ